MPEAEAEKLAWHPELADQNPLMKELFTKPGIHLKFTIYFDERVWSDWEEGT